MKRHIATSLLTIVVLASGAAARAQVPGAEPVAKELVEGRTLTLADANCAVTAPGDDWAWLWMPKLGGEKRRIYLCAPPPGRVPLQLQVTHERIFQTNDEFIRGFVTGVRGSVEKSGSTIEDEHHEPSDLPIAGASFRYSFTVVAKNGQRTHWHGCVGAAGVIYGFQEISSEGGESPEFVSVVKSFRLLKKVEPPPALGGFLLYVAIVAGFAIVGRVVGMNGSAAAVVAVLALAAVRMYGAATAGGGSPHDQGYRAGQELGYALLPLLAAFFDARSFAKKRAAAAAAAAAPPPT